MDSRLIKITKEIKELKYKDADVIILAGSIVRGEETKYSDLDIVVIYKSIKNAYRESFLYKNIPVEAFVHDKATLIYFFNEVDKPMRKPSLATMIVEGIEIPKETELSMNIKVLAKEYIDKGVEELSKIEIDKYRYLITDLIDDIREPRNKDELIATTCQLYEIISNFYIRINKRWSGSGKTIPRILKMINPEMFRNFSKALDEVFINENPDFLIQLVENILLPYGGFLFDGYKLDAPENWRKD